MVILERLRSFYLVLLVTKVIHVVYGRKKEKERKDDHTIMYG